MSALDAGIHSLEDWGNATKILTYSNNNNKWYSHHNKQVYLALDLDKLYKEYNGIKIPKILYALNVNSTIKIIKTSTESHFVKLRSMGINISSINATFVAMWQLITAEAKTITVCTVMIEKDLLDLNVQEKMIVLLG